MNKNIVWAIDPQEKSARTSCASDFERSLHAHQFSTRLVYASSGMESLSSKKQAMKRYLKRLGAKRAKITILLENKKSKKNAAEKVEAFAARVSSPLIALTSRGQSTFTQFFIGSFAEDILLKSKRPILFLPKKASKKFSLNPILFTTDFSAHSRRALHRLLPLAKAWKSEIIIYHALQLPGPSLYAVPMGGQVLVPENYFQQQEDWARAMGHRWIKLASRLGVKARFILCEEPAFKGIASSILKVAKAEKVGCIAAASVSSKLANFVLGSVASELVQQNGFPLLLCGPECVRAGATPLKAPKKLFHRDDEFTLEHDLWNKEIR
jgi:nucleotide-binding universal stress UspA family protein